jgi:polyphosphate kinase 2 (PPK2 family)
MAVLDELDLSRHLSKKRYKELKKAWQLELLTLQQYGLRLGERAILNLEGMDAAGKGGAIRRLIEPLDPRGYKVYRIGAPDPNEQARHYLYRFWTKVPLPRELVVFDRSWYGRVLVERVHGLASEAEWRRAYDEINAFERTLTDSGVVLVKMWFHIDPEEQYRRFQRRLADPFKAYKMTDEDWRNREHWHDYVAAAEDMFARTDTPWAPWTVIPANDKRLARLQAMEATANALRWRAETSGLYVPPPQAPTVTPD